MAGSQNENPPTATQYNLFFIALPLRSKYSRSVREARKMSSCSRNNLVETWGRNLGTDGTYPNSFRQTGG